MSRERPRRGTREGHERERHVRERHERERHVRERHVRERNSKQGGSFPITGGKEKKPLV